MQYVLAIFFSVQPPPFIEWIESIGVEVGSMTLNPLTTNVKTSCGQMENVPLNASVSVHTFNCPSDATGNGVLVTMNTAKKYPLVVCEVTLHLTSKWEISTLVIIEFLCQKKSKFLIQLLNGRQGSWFPIRSIVTEMAVHWKKIGSIKSVPAYVYIPVNNVWWVKYQNHWTNTFGISLSNRDKLKQFRDFKTVGGNKSSLL